MRNKSINNELKRQETAFLDQAKINQRKLFPTRNSLLEHLKFSTEKKSKKKKNDDLLFKTENFEKENNKIDSKNIKFSQSLAVFRPNLIAKNISAFNENKLKSSEKERIKKIDFRNFIQKYENNLPKLKENDKKWANNNEICFDAIKKKDLEDRLKFLKLLKLKKNPAINCVEKNRQLTSDFLDLNLLVDSKIFESDKKKRLNEKNEILTFEEISQKLLESKNSMTRDLQILKEMKLARDLDLTRANLSNFRVSQKEMIRNFIKRKKREFSNHVFDYNDQNINEKIRRKFQKTVYLIMDKLSNLKLTIDDIFSKKIFPRKPFEKPLSRQFLQTVKNNDIEGVVEFLQKDRYLLYSFDYAKKTALHWAAERHFLYLMYFLLNHGAEIEAKDMAGRTPLFLAVKNGDRDSLDTIQLLLAYGANPSAFSYGKKFASNYTEVLAIKNLLKQSQMFQLMKDLQPRVNRMNFWKTKVQPFFLSPSLKKYLESNIHNLVKIF